MNSIKSPKVCALAVVMITTLISHFSHAEVLRWPQGCLSGDLEITNSETTEIKAWLQKSKPTLVSETEMTIPASSTLKIPIKSAATAESFSLLHFKNNGTLQASFKCGKKIYPAHSFEGGLLTYRRTDLAQNQVHLKNLFTSGNSVKIELLDRRQQILSTLTVKLNSLEKLTYTLPNLPTPWFYFRIEATNRLAAFNLTTLGSEGPFLVNPQPVITAETAAYFVVGSRTNEGDSFIAKISNPAMIAKAREQIANSTLEKIVFAQIQKGHGNFNRNWSKRDKSFWSWSVTEVTNIADLGSTSCNGLPQAVEDRVDSWLKEPGRICFWSYRVKKELKPSDVAAGAILQ